jgi:uncharacterized protein (UPF0212 family)
VAAHDRVVVLTWPDAVAAADTLDTASAGLLRELAARHTSGDTASTVSAVDGRRWFLERIEVRGHVGAGSAPVQLELPAAHGIVIVTARNGTGKTTIADAVRHVLSDGSPRKYVLAPDNLHCPDREISVAVRSGDRSVTVACGHDGSVQWLENGAPPRPVPAEWLAAYERHLPVLLYPEVAPLINDPSGLHGFLKGALQLNVLQVLQDELAAIRSEGRELRKRLDKAHGIAIRAAHSAGTESLATDLERCGATPTADSRHRLRTTIASWPETTPSRPPALPEIVSEVDRQEILTALQAFEAARAAVVPGAEAVRTALQTLADPTLAYLETARESRTCPVCGATEVAWRQTADEQARKLEAVLRDFNAARERLAHLLGKLRMAVPALATPTLQRLAGRDDAATLVALWNGVCAELARLQPDRTTAAAVNDAVARVEELRLLRDGLTERLVAAHEEALGARSQLRRVVSDWLDEMERAEPVLDRAAAAVDLDNAVTKWIKSTRDIVFEPIGDRISALWNALNNDSDLTLTHVKISGGTKQAGKVDVGLQLGDGPVPPGGSATHVMSTGQRNALSLATYLPRATQPTSPFRFIVMDDPIHAFDGYRVRYLARQLISVASTHQVVVLTHDDRLWHELRASGHVARHINLERAADGRSLIRVRDITSPGAAHLTDLEAALRDHDKIGAKVATDAAITALALALCRQALDAEICTQVEILGRRTGHTDEQIAAGISATKGTHDQIRLLNRYATQAGLPPIDLTPAQARIVRVLNNGAHGRAPDQASRDDRHAWLTHTRALVAAVGALK